MTIKKISIISLCMLFAAACQPTGQNNSDNQNNSTTDTVATTNGQADNETAKTPTFMSPDAALFNVRGEVKEFTQITYECDEQGKKLENGYNYTIRVAFDADKHAIFDGKNYPILNIYKMELVRNEKDQIESIVSDSTFDPPYHMQETLKPKYNEQGFLSELIFDGHESGNEKTYTYNEQGDLVSSERKGEGEGTIGTTSERFEILDKDKLGNWTKRKKTEHNFAESIEGEVELDETRWYIEIRNIVYK